MRKSFARAGRTIASAGQGAAPPAPPGLAVKPSMTVRVGVCLAVVLGLAAGLLGPRVASGPPEQDLRDALPRIPPREPKDALASFRIRDGFRLDLLAAEPLVTSPVAMDYDEDGRAFVVEMRDYPYTDRTTDKPFVERTTDRPLGRVRRLVDRDGDGIFDHSTVFAEDLSWPTGVACWKGGVFVAATPDVWYLKDTDGDGTADVRVKVFTGFRKFNVQAVMNNLRWGLDHRIYGAGATNGGQIRRARDPAAKPVTMAARDFRFDPRTEDFELLSGGARFGNTFDDRGQRFICNLRNPIQHVVLPSAYLARNPFLPVRSALHDVAQAGDAIPVFRASPPEPWRVVNARRLARDTTKASPRSESTAVGYVTSASGVTVYRGAAYPPRYYGNVFLGEVAGNLIHRQTLTPSGVTFVGQRAEAEAEFVASTDNWFRPVNFVNAPDGTLHVLDMYREVIEHPWSIPDDIKAHLDLESGRDRGRIYRLAPPNFKAPPPPRLGRAGTAELVAALENPNSWWRETAHRLLFEQQDRAAVPRLRSMLRAKAAPPTAVPDVKALGRLHALWSLHGLDALNDDDLHTALADPAPGVREHAVRLAERRLAKAPALLDKVLPLAGDDDTKVRFQVAFTLGAVEDPRAVGALARIARRDADDEWVRTAVLSSATTAAGPLLKELLADRPGAGGRRRVLRELAQIVGAANRAGEVPRLLDFVAGARRETADQVEVVLGLADGLTRAGKKLTAVLPADRSGTLLVQTLLTDAARQARDEKVPLEQRQAAIQLLGCTDLTTAGDLLLPLLEARQPPPVQAAAVRTLAGFRGPAVPGLLLKHYHSLTPAVRGGVIDALTSRPEWAEPLLSAVEARTVPVSDIPLARRNLLARSPNPAVRDRATALFGQASVGPRGEIIEKYRAALTRPADRGRGLRVYQRECQACHRLGEHGHDVGPNLAMIQHRAPADVLLHILDPNREVAPNYLEYVLTLRDGRLTRGVILAETETGLTLGRAEGVRETVLRSEIDEVAATGQSLMPEGLERSITVPEMADLLALLLEKT